MSTFPVPIRLAVEGPSERAGAYVVAIERDCLWLQTASVTFRAGTSVRLAVRLEDGPSLGIAGVVVRGLRGSFGVRIEGTINRAIVGAWSEGHDADVSPSQRLFTSEAPTADVPKIPEVKTQILHGRLRDTLQDFVFSRPRP